LAVFFDIGVVTLFSALGPCLVVGAAVEACSEIFEGALHIAGEEPPDPP